jgi:hypothetical protein
MSEIITQYQVRYKTSDGLVSELEDWGPARPSHIIFRIVERKLNSYSAGVYDRPVPELGVSRKYKFSSQETVKDDRDGVEIICLYEEV